jgi:hypothetical protein
MFKLLVTRVMWTDDGVSVSQTVIDFCGKQYADEAYVILTTKPVLSPSQFRTVEKLYN